MKNRRSVSIKHATATSGYKLKYMRTMVAVSASMARARREYASYPTGDFYCRQQRSMQHRELVRLRDASRIIRANCEGCPW